MAREGRSFATQRERVPRDKPLIKNVATATHIELRAQHNKDLKNNLVKYHHGINCWSPVINIMRHWAWGRNDETYGECPVLSGAFAKAFVVSSQAAICRCL